MHFAFALSPLKTVRLALAAGLVSLLAVANAAPSLAQEGGLRPLGSVTYRVQPVPPQKGVFELDPDVARLRAIRFRVDRGAADIRSVRLIYRNGNINRADLSEQLEQGETSALFRLPREGALDSIELTYVPRGDTRITLLADGRGMEPPPPPPRPEPARWSELGCKSVGFLVDKDTIALNTPERFSSLRLRSTGFDIDMIQMAVRYGNGAVDTYDIRSVIPSGGATRPIDLRGDARRISSIELLYRTRGVVIGGKTRLCVDGRSAPRMMMDGTSDEEQ